MRKIVIVTVLLIGCLGIAQIPPESDFEDGTLQNWTDTDGNTTGMSVVLDPENSRQLLEKICDGSNSAVGEMAISNVIDYNGDYNCYDPNAFGCIGAFEMYIKDENVFDLHLRLGFRGANNTKIVSSEAELSNWPIDSNWYFAGIDFDPTEFFVVEGAGTVEETLEDVIEMRIIHNADISFDGAIVNGILKIDYMTWILLLNTHDIHAQKTIFYPNPAQELLTISSEIPIDQYRIHNVTGAMVSEGKFENNQQQIDVSNLKTGMYFIEMSSGDLKTSQKFIKQ
jgi:Secretion system C-terminal sorting domain